MVFKKGKDPNRNLNGRPTGSRNFTTKVREALEKIADGEECTNEEALVKSILKKAIVDGDSATQRMIWNYLDGMPHQSTDLTTNGKELPTPIINVSGNYSHKEDNSSESED